MSNQELKLELEKRFRLLRNVQGAHVDFDEAGDVHAIGVFSDGTRPPKEIKRDVEETFRNVFGYRVNHNKISIVEQSFDFEEQAALSRVRFLTAYQIQRAHGVVEGVVQLEYQGMVISESVEAHHFEMQLEYIVANATAQALMRVLTDYNIRVDRIRIIDMGDNDIVCTTLSIVNRNSGANNMYVGAAIRSKDLLSSVAKATLDALNRKMDNMN